MYLKLYNKSWGYGKGKGRVGVGYTFSILSSICRFIFVGEKTTTLTISYRQYVAVEFMIIDAKKFHKY